MTVEAAAGHLAALARLGVPAAGIHIGGGEPFGNFDRLLQIVRAARGAGLAGIGYVETGGFWATDEATVRERLRALADAGMVQLSISADPYHQEFIPPERVRLLFSVAREVLGPRGVRVRRWKWLDEARDVSAMPEPERLDLFRAFLRRYPERMNGRAAQCLAPLIEKRCQEPFPGDCHDAILSSGHVHIDPEGWVYPGTCAGIALGLATAERPLDELLRTWRLEDAPLVAALVEGGPQRLAEFDRVGAKHPPYVLEDRADKCRLCWSVRKRLAEAGAENKILQPASSYLTT
jgi:MoaA/NifB/PqqE/SkfB family radical SAM enzyme